MKLSRLCQAKNKPTAQKTTQRRAGEILREMEKAKGAAQQGWNETPLPEERTFEQPKTYEELGITYKDAHIWQTMVICDAAEALECLRV